LQRFEGGGGYPIFDSVGWASHIEPLASPNFFSKGDVGAGERSAKRSPSALDEEDADTLAAIDEGIRDAEAGRVETAEKARELLPK
jgi:hypothetical protein